MKTYPKHNQTTAIRFIDYVIQKFPFRIHTIRTDHGHEFQALFHWHSEDLGIRYIYINHRSPQLNGKVERSHLTDDLEFYQLLSYIDDVDLNKKLEEWEKFYNFDRPHKSLKGKTHFEIIKRETSTWYSCVLRELTYHMAAICYSSNNVYNYNKIVIE